MHVRSHNHVVSSLPRNCYRVAPQVWAGSYIGMHGQADAQEHIAWLCHIGVSIIIDLTAYDDMLPSYMPLLATNAPHIVRQQFPIIDGSAPSEVQMVAILRAIDDAVASEQTVYIHCWGGFGRTGLVVACWYKRTEGSGTAALKRLQEARYAIQSRRPSPDYSAQVSFVMRWQEPPPAQALQWLQWRNRFRGAILGAAVGDAIGVTNEMRDRHEVTLTNDLLGGGIFDIKPGEWTDDTAMVLCVSESLIQKRGFDAHDQMDRFVRWWRYGYMTCNGCTYDVGNTTRLALFSYIQTGDPLSGVQSSHSAGNGALSRVAPISLYYAMHPDVLDQMAAYSSMLTHATVHSIDACRYVSWLIAQFVRGVPKGVALGTPWPYAPLCDDIAQITRPDRVMRDFAAMDASSYVVDMLEIVLWALRNHHDFASGLLALANAGGLTTTSCTIYGALAGALYGDASIPARWLAQLVQRDKIEWYAEELLRVARPMTDPV